MAIGTHGSDEFRKLAEDGTILRVQVGSGVHGISISGTDDRDEMGVCIEPEEFVLGLRQFEQYEHHTAWEREGGLRNRSGHGDLDITIYSLRKFARLALQGNPSIIAVFFIGGDDVVKCTHLGQQLQELAPLFISKASGPRYLGYLNEQRRRMRAKDGKGDDVSRPELIEKYGFDTKFAGHMVRLGFQGMELLSTGRLTLPMPVEQRELVKAVRTGEFTMDWVLDYTEKQEDKIRSLMGTSALPDHPDRQAVDEWLVDAYQHEWFMRSVEQASR